MQKNTEKTAQMNKNQCTYGLDCEKNEFITGNGWQTITCKYPGYNSTTRNFFWQGTALHEVCGQTRQKLKNTQEHAMIVHWKGEKESTQIRTGFFLGGGHALRSQILIETQRTKSLD